jgi:hypothetical protein
MIVVMPQGPTRETDEWAGPWESYIVRDVVPNQPAMPCRVCAEFTSSR